MLWNVEKSGSFTEHREWNGPVAMITVQLDNCFRAILFKNCSRLDNTIFIGEFNGVTHGKSSLYRIPFLLAFEFDGGNNRLVELSEVLNGQATKGLLYSL
jgi:hypothetical protein